MLIDLLNGINHIIYSLKCIKLNFSFSKVISASFIGRLIGQIQIAIFGLAVASLLNKEAFGYFQQLLSFSLISVSIARIGLEIITQLEITKKSDLHSIDFFCIDLIKIKAISSALIVMPIILLLLYVFNDLNSNLYLVFLLSSYSFFLAVNKYIADAVMVYSLRIVRSLLIMNFSALLRLCLIFYFIFIGYNDIKLIILGMLIIELSIFIYLMIFYKIFSKNFLSLNLISITKENLRHAWHQYGDVLTSLMLSMAGGVVVLSIFDDLELLASYTFILAITLGIFSGGSLNSMLEPIMNTILLRKLDKNNNDFKAAKVEELLSAWCSLCIMTNLFFALSIYIFIGIINEQFLNLKYTSEISKIFFFYVSISLFFWTYHYSSWAILKKRLDITRNAGIISGILHFIFIGVFTYYFGLDGAIGSYILANIVKTFIMHYYLDRPKFLKGALIMCLKKIYSFISIVFLIFITFYFSNNNLSYLISLFSLFIAFIIVLRFYLDFNRIYLREINN